MIMIDMAVIGIVGFMLGYAFALIDRTPGFFDREEGKKECLRQLSEELSEGLS